MRLFYAYLIPVYSAEHWHEYPRGLWEQTPLIEHGLEAHGSILISQFGPVKSDRHKQLYPIGDIRWHVALIFKH